MLPKQSCTEVLRQIRGRDKQIPVLILTARDELRDKVQHFEMGGG